MPVARDHLRRERIRLEPEPLAGDPLHLGIERRVRPDRPRELADAIRLGVRAGRLARGAGRIPRRRYAEASTPQAGIAVFDAPSVAP